MDLPTASPTLSFGEWLQLKRRRHIPKLTQEDLANALTVSIQTISNWETSTGAPKLLPQQTQSLCRILGCSLEELATIAEQSEQGCSKNWIKHRSAQA